MRELHEAFEIAGLDGRHWCLVHEPLGVSLREWQGGFEGGRVGGEVLRGVVRRILLALDFLHEEAGVIHTGNTPCLRRLTRPLTPLDIQASNILLGLSTAEPIDAFVAAEQDHPSPHKTVNSHRTIYRSRRLSVALDHPPGVPTLTDFGLAVQDAHAPHAGLIQPLLFRSPEVILKMPWDGRADIWNLGVLIS